MDICCTRSFNHCGPGQDDRFVISSMVKQFVLIRKGLQAPVIHMGNGSIVRDFIDVRDVVRGYYLLLKEGRRGEVYNICSGRGRSISSIIGDLSRSLGIPVEICQDQAQIRPIDNPLLVGSNEKITRETNWTPEINFEQSLQSMICFWENRLCCHSV